MKPEELQDRTKRFAVQVMKLVQNLPDTIAGRAVARPLVRCGTAVGSTWRATCKSRNRFDFLSRIGVVEEAADESCYWFELIIDAGLWKVENVQPLLDEGRALKEIFTASRMAAVKRYQRPGGSDAGEIAGEIDFDDDDDVPF